MAVITQEYNRRTFARMIQTIGQVTSPNKVANMEDLWEAITKWEMKNKALQKKYNQTFTEEVLIAIANNMMPKSIQEYIVTGVAKESSYRNMIDKVKLLVGNKVLTGAVPMDLSSVGSGGDGVFVASFRIRHDLEQHVAPDAPSRHALDTGLAS